MVPWPYMILFCFFLTPDRYGGERVLWSYMMLGSYVILGSYMALGPYMVLGFYVIRGPYMMLRSYMIRRHFGSSHFLSSRKNKPCLNYSSPDGRSR